MKKEVFIDSVYCVNDDKGNIVLRGEWEKEIDEKVRKEYNKMLENYEKVSDKFKSDLWSYELIMYNISCIDDYIEEFFSRGWDWKKDVKLLNGNLLLELIKGINKVISE